MSGVPLLAARGLACGYTGRIVLADATLTLGAGELVGVVGPNGAGKSTLLKTLAGLLAPRGGAIEVNGRPLASLGAAALARHRAYMPQTLPADDGWTVREIVRMGRFAYQRGWGLLEGAEDRRAIATALAATHLEALADRPIAQLSGGQRQRAYMARALAQETSVLMLDEPTAHLDLGHQVEFFHLLREVMATRSVGAVTVLHDLNLAAQFCHRLWVVDAGDSERSGRIVADGSPETVLGPDLVERVFGLAVQVRHHPETGLPYLLPSSATRTAPGDGPRVHVVAGGGGGERLIPTLHRRGYRVSVGAINLLDSDQALATRLGLPVVTEAPFSPLSAGALTQLEQTLATAAVVVVGDVAWGSGNVGNLRVLAAMGSGPAIWLVAETPIADRDFTQGEATALWGQLIARGAKTGTLAEILAAHP